MTPTQAEAVAPKVQELLTGLAHEHGAEKVDAALGACQKFFEAIYAIPESDRPITMTILNAPAVELAPEPAQ